MNSARLHADVTIVGAGPAGIAAATRAAESGRRVVVLDENLQPGGQIWRHASSAQVPAQALPWLERLARSGATVVAGAKVMDVQRGSEREARFVVHGERGASPVIVDAERLVLATGARELFLPFPGWTLPGVIGIGGAQALLKSGTSFAGKRVALAGSGPLLLAVAAALARSGAKLMVVAEQTPANRLAAFTAGLLTRPAILWQALAYRGAFPRVRYRTGTWVARASGDERVRAVTLTDGVRRRDYECDVLCAAFGLVPNTELARLLGCAMDAERVAVDDGLATSVDGVFCAGEPTGVGGVEQALVQGEIAGLRAAGNEGTAGALQARHAATRRAANALSRAFALRPELRTLATAGTMVCRCEDVTLDAISPEWTPRQAKLYTRCGMGPCQGRICGAALQWLYGWPTDVVRPPVEPVLISTLLADAATLVAPPDHGD